MKRMMVLLASVLVLTACTQPKKSPRRQPQEKRNKVQRPPHLLKRKRA